MKSPGKLVVVISSIAFFLLVSTGCRGLAAIEPTTPPTLSEVELTPGDIPLSLMHDNQERTYVLHIPSGWDARQPAPVVLAFHGIGQDASEMMRISELNQQADESGFVVVYANGTGKYKSWNGGKCCGEAAKYAIDDIGFVRDLIASLSPVMSVDAKRIYITGFSNGAIFAYRAACELSDQVAAVAPVSAVPIKEDLETCAPSRPIAVLHFHGTADDANPYDGGFTQAGYEFVSVRDTMAFWTAQNDCPAQPVTEETGSIRHEIHSPCAEGSSVELYTIIGGKHAWPGGEAVSQKMGEPTREISASRIMWEFFAAHPMP